MKNTIESKNMILKSCTKELLEAAVAGNSFLAKSLNAKISEGWSEFGVPVCQFALKQLNLKNTDQEWWTYFPIHKDNNELIGSCGYKGAPDQTGMVEIGFEIVRPYRKRGLATEIVNALIDNAFKYNTVKKVIAHTRNSKGDATRVLEKCGLTCTDEVKNEGYTNMWKWTLNNRKSN